jgi:hypothetical protein
MKKIISKHQKNLPGYKFITLSQIYSICEKYNLYICDVELFNGEVPDKNIQDMSRFPTQKLKDNGCFYRTQNNSPLYHTYHQNYYNLNYNFFICASEDDFINNDNVVKVGREIFIDNVLSQKNKMSFSKRERIPDPILLCPLEEINITGTDILFAIVTAWGPEAQDPKVFNEISN